MKYLGFSFNTYERCMTKNIINGNKCSIIWYVDNKNMFHVDINMVNDIMGEIKNYFGDMVIRRGDTPDSLDNNLLKGKNKKVDLIMKYQIEYTVRQFKDICYLK